MAFSLLFSGQGAQRVGMGSSLYEHSPIARDCYDRADEILGWSLKELSFNGPSEQLTETHVCQPALYVMGYSICAILRERDQLNDLDAVLGLSLGELTALAVSGALDFETGLRVVAERGRLMQAACETTEGAMASLIGGSLDSVLELCRRLDVDLANLNCPDQVVISGERDKIQAAMKVAREGDFRMVVPLNVAGAYHSRLMEPARLGFAEFLAPIALKKPSALVFSNVTGQPGGDPENLKAALVEQIVSTVRWEDCMRNAAKLGATEFLECGPGKVLAGLARRTDRSWRVRSLEGIEDLPV